MVILPVSFNDIYAKEASHKLRHENKDVRFQCEPKPKQNVPIARHMATWIIRTNACSMHLRGTDYGMWGGKMEGREPLFTLKVS